MPAKTTTRRKSRQPKPLPFHVYLSLGSNLGDSVFLIRQAIKLISVSGIKVIRVSSFYKTEPVELLDQPWFINCAVEVRTTFSPRQVLRALKSVERTLGRRRGKPKGPRLIDIDILLYENMVVRSPGLTIPHPRMTGRRFVLVPLREIGPHLTHPVTGQTISELLSKTADASKVIKLRKKF